MFTVVCSPISFPDFNWYAHAFRSFSKYSKGVDVPLLVEDNPPAALVIVTVEKKTDRYKNAVFEEKKTLAVVYVLISLSQYYQSSSVSLGFIVIKKIIFDWFSVAELEEKEIKQSN